MDRRVWFSPRALKLHAVILVVVPAFMALCVWQLTRALGGNELSWAYVFEWPFFAAYAVYMWWRLVHEAPDAEQDTPATTTPDDPPGEGETGDAAAARATEDAEMAAYNEYLAELAARDEATGR